MVRIYRLRTDPRRPKPGEEFEVEIGVCHTISFPKCWKIYYVLQILDEKGSVLFEDEGEKKEYAGDDQLDFEIENFMISEPGKYRLYLYVEGYEGQEWSGCDDDYVGYDEAEATFYVEEELGFGDWEKYILPIALLLFGVALIGIFPPLGLILLGTGALMLWYYLRGGFNWPW